jgi:hypothetical protein
MPDLSVTQHLLSLPRLNRNELSSLWQQLFNKETPIQMRKDLVIRILAYRLQEQEFGGLSDTGRRRLRKFASVLEAHSNAATSTQPAIKSGTRLERQWKDQVHVVEVEAKGYEYKGSRYESLSEIARLITGTRWSGPLFFGLTRKSSSPSREAQ